MTAGGERLGDVADAHADDLGRGVLLGEGGDAAADLGEEVAGFELEVVVVDVGHGGGIVFAAGVGADTGG